MLPSGEKEDQGGCHVNVADLRDTLVGHLARCIFSILLRVRCFKELKNVISNYMDQRQAHEIFFLTPVKVGFLCRITECEYRSCLLHPFTIPQEVHCDLNKISQLGL